MPHKNSTDRCPRTHTIIKQLLDTHLRLHILPLDLITTLQLISAFQVSIKGQLAKDF